MRDFFQGHAPYRALFLLILLLAPLLVWQGVYAGRLEHRRNTALLRSLGALQGLVFAVVPWETGGGGGLGLGAGPVGSGFPGGAARVLSPAPGLLAALRQSPLEFL
ncbi:hypothetical protein TthAA37_25310 (plasmid) [Thermus thermophilus]|uniref:hypothetical protein n=1 Tax=Thermus thermophilus TaxID=274 RepID=UPI001C75BC13|nr:hypothetical protein [Thermus thermophilus]BCZ90634.1 hypothetical protein TthAA22_24390 [Thermus thermophilus]BCZ93342.1 hypothetical protein TthAA37_25310 [Thermus thermophilus]